MTYDETVNYLYSLQGVGIKLGLDNITCLLDGAGNPHKAFRSLHIGGTNGKGSTAAVAASILRNLGYRVGLFTSPHLVDFTERIRVDGEMISTDDVIRLAARFRETARLAGLQPTFFEITTAMAFQYFRENDVEYAVVEVGLGGRLDSTNVLEPEAVVITNVSMDHESFLGNTIAEIAYEKAGIIKPGVPVVTGAAGKALEIIRETAQGLSSPLFQAGLDFGVQRVETGRMGIRFDYTGMGGEFHDLNSPLVGLHQAHNSGIAIAACAALSEAGSRVDRTVLANALDDIEWPGRMEQVMSDPAVILDSAHNPAAAETLAATLALDYPDCGIIMVLGLMKDKDIDGVVGPLVRRADHVIVTAPAYSRAASPAELEEAVLKYYAGPVEQAGTVESALSRARELAGPGAVIIVSGSFYTTGEAREVLLGRGILSTLRE